MKSKMQLFEKKNVRSVWDEEQEKWWFSVADVCAILAESEDGRKYWSVLKTRLKIEVRKALTDEWDKAGVNQGEEYAF